MGIVERRKEGGLKLQIENLAEAGMRRESRREER